MIKKVLIIILGLLAGTGLSYFAIFYTPIFKNNNTNLPLLNPLVSEFGQKEVIGFLPYWLLTKATKDYTKYITTLSYYGLTIDTDGTIKKLDNPQELEPGWNALRSGKLDPFLATAKQNKTKLSLLVFSGSDSSISQLLSDPITHAKNLTKEVIPIMKQYGFTDLNLDIETTSQEASDSARDNFSRFVTTVKNEMDQQKAGTLSLDITAISFVKKGLIDPYVVGNIVDKLIIMAYDFHYIGSIVTGPVAPLTGAGSIYEFDTQTAVNKALDIMPGQKIILGSPLYGYEWETVDSSIQSGVIPGTGKIASNQRVEGFLASCATCSARFEDKAQESYLVYKEDDTNTYHQIFYPDKNSTLAKIKFAKDKKLGGIALWALGYEGNTILNPLVDYKNNNLFTLH